MPEPGSIEEAQESVRAVIAKFDDPTREGLANTPRRYIKFLSEFLSPEPFHMTTFSNDGMDEMIVQTNIPFFSLCEHHLAPFFGTAAIAYIPNGKIVGLSKLARTLDKFARRLQNQERITSDVAEYINNQLAPRGVAVQLTAQHLCMSMRGIQKPGATTTTTKLIGAFKDDAKARGEFIAIIQSSK